MTTLAHLEDMRWSAEHYGNAAERKAAHETSARAWAYRQYLSGDPRFNVNGDIATAPPQPYKKH